ncbi:16077_t:CDS:1, partial [Funneliformis geosporum]
LEIIHKADFVHHDFHSGNILLVKSYRKWQNGQWLIGDLGLSRPVSNITSNDKIYGIIPYIAPEILNGGSFSQAADIYSMGMIMWELTSGCRPFANSEYTHRLNVKIIDGKRPEITDDTPECFASLMKKCWDLDPTKRPSITEIRETFSDWYSENECVEQFFLAEERRLESVLLKKIASKSIDKHPKAIFTSRTCISKSSNLTP